MNTSESRSVVSDSLRPHGLWPARLTPLSMGFSRQGYWSGLPFLPPRNLPDPGIETMPPAVPTPQLNSFTAELP